MCWSTVLGLKVEIGFLVLLFESLDRFLPLCTFCFPISMSDIETLLVFYHEETLACNQGWQVFSSKTKKLLTNYFWKFICLQKIVSLWKKSFLRSAKTEKFLLNSESFWKENLWAIKKQFCTKMKIVVFGFPMKQFGNPGCCNHNQNSGSCMRFLTPAAAASKMFGPMRHSWFFPLIPDALWVFLAGSFLLTH